MALEKCDGVLLIMSYESASSEWVKDEVNSAINRKLGKLIPILYKKCYRRTFIFALLGFKTWILQKIFDPAKKN
ncbi:hypothetical protein Dfri01_10000 [Dyadobacter frigoris]|nr:hypothetical protein Dfri01_10000 [Dyadobacter frigoris]